MTKQFIIKDDIYKTSTLFILNCDVGKLFDITRKYGVNLSSLGEYSCGTVVKARRMFFRIVWVEKSKDIGCLVHELFHLVTIILRDKGITIKANLDNGEVGDEAAAYLMEFYTKKVFKKLGIICRK